MPSSAFSYLDDVKPDLQEKPDGSLVPLESSGEEQERKKLEKEFQTLSFGTSSAPDTYEPQKLNATHREIIRLTALGYNNTKVARILGITPVTVRYTIKSPLGQDMLADIEQDREASVRDVQERLNELSPFAAERFADVLADDKADPALQLRAAEKVLEMTGHKAANVNLNLNSHLGAEEIDAIKKRARKNKNVVAENAEDAEFEEVNENDGTE